MTIAALVASHPWLLAGWTMLHFFWVGGLLGLLNAALRRAMRRARPEVRYGVALSGLAALAVAPVLIAVLLFRAPGRAPVELDPWPPIDDARSSPLREPSDPGRPIISASNPPSVRPVMVTDRADPGDLLAAAATALPVLWLVGAPATFLLLATGLVGAERLRSQSRPLSDGDLPERCRRLARTLGLVRPVALGVCDRLVTPLLLGVVRPMILLPATALTGWSPEQVEMALMHELAHVRRLDNLVNLVQRTVEALLFFHPAVWWVSGWVRLEREHCCDKIVIAHTGHPRPYAELLAALAVPGAPRSRAAVAMAEAPIVERIRRILNLEDQPMRLSRAFIALVAGLIVAPAALITSLAGPPAPEKPQTPAPARPQGPGDARMETLFLQALHGAEVFRDGQGQVSAMARIAGAQARAGDRDAARQTFAEAVAKAKAIRLDESRGGPHILLEVAKVQAEAGFRDEAIASLRTLLQIAEAPVENDFSKNSLYPRLVSAQAELGDEEGIRLTLQRSLHFYASSKENMIQESASRRLVELQAMSRDLTGALRMLDDPSLFRGEYAERNRHFALLGIVAQLKADDRQVAGPILERARQAVDAQTDEVRERWRTNGYSRSRNHELAIIAQAEARLGRFAEAVNTARAIDPNQLRPIPEGGARPGRFTEVTTTLTEDIDSDRLLFPNRKRATRKPAGVESVDAEWSSKAATFASIAEEQAKAGDQAGARQLAAEIDRIVEHIDDDNYKHSTLNQLLITSLTIGDRAKAIRIAEAMNPIARSHYYLAIAKLQRRANDNAGARATLEAALRRLGPLIDASKPDGPANPTPTRDRLLGGKGLIQASQGDLKGAIETIERISSSEIKSDTLTMLAYDRASLNDLDGAMDVVKRIGSPEEEAKALEQVLAALPRREAAGD